jgi:uncharacterized protein
MARKTVTTRDVPDKLRVEAVLEDGRVAGYAQYLPRGSTYVFHHTVVEDEYEGQGIGSQLAAGVVAFARENGIGIVPRCSFIRGYLRSHEDTHDVVAPGSSLEPDPDAAAG